MEIERTDLGLKNVNKMVEEGKPPVLPEPDTAEKAPELPVIEVGQNPSSLAGRFVVFLLGMNTRRAQFIAGVVLLALCALSIPVLAYYYYVTLPPADFPSNTVVRIAPGVSVTRAGEILRDAKVIDSVFFFRTLVYLMSSDDTVLAGSYIFYKPARMVEVVRDVISTDYAGRLVKITVPEGYTNKEIGDVLGKAVPVFNVAGFLELAKNKEGRLFPDTYFIPYASSPEDVIRRMSDNYESKMAAFRADIKKSGRKESDVLIMASIVEREARLVKTRQTIAGILWKRLKIGMPLQVDATFGYILNKGTSEITADDLKMDSPYNTYRYRGLPPTPISNPGEDAIYATVNPIETKYLFYLSDSEGGMHYAVDFEGHKANRIKWLK